MTALLERESADARAGRWALGFEFGEASGAVAADFGAGDGDLHGKVAGDLLFELLVQAAFKFPHLAATQAGDVDVIARAVTFVIVTIATQVQEVELVDKAVLFEEVDGPVDGDEMHARIDFLGAREYLIDVQVLLGVIHDLKDDAALPGHAQAALTEELLQFSGSLRGV
jgi:hypothetical protein